MQWIDVRTDVYVPYAMASVSDDEIQGVAFGMSWLVSQLTEIENKVTEQLRRPRCS